MRPFRVIVSLLVAAVVVCAVLIVVAFIPSVQTRVARHFLSRQPSFRGTVEEVEIELQTARWKNLQLVGEGWSLNVPSAAIEGEVLPAVRKKVHVHHFVAHGWALNLSSQPLPPAAKTAWRGFPAQLPLATLGLAEVAQPLPVADATVIAATVFRGVFPLLDLPFDLSVDQVDLEGEIIFRSQTGGPIERIHVSMTGGDLASQHTGKFEIAGSTQVNVPAMQLSSVKAQVTLQAHQSTPRLFDLLKIEAELNADGMTGATVPRLFLKGGLERVADHEVYTFALSSTEATSTKELAVAHAEFPDAKGRISGTWTADASDSNFAPFMLGAPLPSFVVKGNGMFDAEGTFQEVHASGMFTGKVARWEVFSPSLLNLGELQLRGTFDVLQNGKDVRVERLSAEIADTHPILSIEALQGIELNGDTGEIKVADPRRDLVRITLASVPISWLQPFVGALSLTGGELQGELIGRARESGLLIRSTTPLTLPHLSLSQAGQPLLQNTDLSLSVSGSYSPEGWQADVSALELRSAGATWLSATAKVGRPTEKPSVLKSTGHYQLDLVGASRQPALAQLNVFRSGLAEGDFSAVWASIRQFAANIELKNLSIPGVPPPLPTASLLVRADLQPNGLIKLQVPFQVQHGPQHSDGQLSAEVHTEGSDYVFDSQFTSDLVSVDDLIGLAGLLNTAPEAIAPAEASPTRPGATSLQGPSIPAPRISAAAKPLLPTSTTNSIWAGYRGRVLLGLKKVTYAANFQATDVAGRIQIDPAGLTFDHLTATLSDGGNALLVGSLAFSGKAPESYSLSGELDINHVNPAPYLTALSPGRKATVEGLFDLAMKFSGSAPTVDRLSDVLSEDIKLTSRSGKFRGFAAGSQVVDLDKLQRTASTVGAILSAAAGMVGYGEGVSYSEKLRAGADALRGFSEINFDQLNVELTHLPGQETKISDLSLISPEIRFTGNGTVDTMGTLDWFSRPLHLQVAVAVRGKQADNLKKLGLVGADPDTLGYVPLLDKFPIEGSASGLATDALGKLLNRALAK